MDMATHLHALGHPRKAESIHPPQKHGFRVGAAAGLAG